MSKIHQIPINSILEFFLYFFCCFPFVTPINFGTDMQPYALIVAVVYLIVNNKILVSKMQIPQYTLVIFSTFILSVSWFFSDDLFIILRSYYNYVSLGIISSAVFVSMQMRNGIVEKYLKIFFIIWFVVGLIQFIIYRNFLGFIVANFRTSPTRGVSCLASEPSFYGYMCFFFMMITYKFSKHKLFYMILAIVQIVFLAQSTVSLTYVVLFFMITLFHNLLEKRNFKAIFSISLGIILAIIVIWLINRYMSGSRIHNLIMKFINDPSAIMYDESAEQRMEHISISLNSFINAFGMPHGYAYFITRAKRIMSGYGTLLHELGVIGLAYILIYFRYIKKAFNISFAIVITIVMFSAIQIGIPIFGFIVGMSMYEYSESAFKEKQYNHISRYKYNQA